MTTEEENLNRLRQLADLLGCEADISGGAADIAQRVSEWEEELTVSPEGIMHSDESGADQDHTDDGEQSNNTDASDDVRTIRVRKCLQVVGYYPGTGRPVELALWSTRVLAPSSLITAMTQHGMAEYA